MKKTILFRVDGGKVWGTSMGHIKRAILLAGKLRYKYDIIFIMKNFPDGVGFVKGLGFEVITIAVNENSDRTLKDLCEKYKTTKLVIDLYDCPYTSFFEYTRSKNIKTIVFDLTGKFSQDADILINDTLVKEFTVYPKLSGKTRKYLGPKFFVMDDNVNLVPIRETIKNIMVTTGGSDPAGLSLKILRSMPEILFKFNINVALGPLFTEHKDVLKIVGSRTSVKVYDNPPNFLELLSHQDVVITSAGRTLYECAFFGKSVITVPSIEHEENTSQEYSVLTGSIDLGLWNDKESPGRLAKAISFYEDNPVIRQSIYKKSSNLVDGRGLKRVLGIIG